MWMISLAEVRHEGGQRYQEHICMRSCLSSIERLHRGLTLHRVKQLQLAVCSRSRRSCTSFVATGDQPLRVGLHAVRAGMVIWTDRKDRGEPDLGSQ